MPAENDNERLVENAFTRQSAIFDELYRPNLIVQYKRNRVRQHLLKFLKPASHILELNAGTGDDAIFLAGMGHRVHATDVSKGMQSRLREKTAALGLQPLITSELCSFTTLDQLTFQGPFDHIFSNFAGLNCTEDLKKVLLSFDKLLKPGGLLTLVVLPGFCLWELLLIFKGRFRTALRRFFSARGKKANIHGVTFTCWYYSPNFIKRTLKTGFTVQRVEGLCTVVPPSYIEFFAERHPRIFSSLCHLENRVKFLWPWNHTGDYYIISLKKNITKNC